MLKRLRKNRGFTLVEVLVAFVIFAIMAAMVSTIIQATMQVKQDNTENERLIAQQKQHYYQQNQPASKDTYKTLSGEADANTGSINMNFYEPSGSSKGLAVDYVAADVNSTADVFELEYYVGQEGNEAWKDKDKIGGGGNSGSGSVLQGLNAGIYGSAGIETVTVAVDSRKGETNRYYVYVNAVSSDPGNELENFAQIRLKFPSTIVKYGYVNSNGRDENDGTKWNAGAQLAISGDLQTIRISGDGNSRSIFSLSSQKAVCWIELASPLTAAQIADVSTFFGDSGTNTVTKDTASSITSGGTLNRVKFSRFISEKDGGKEYVNVFAATEDEDTPSTAESTGESEEAP